MQRNNKNFFQQDSTELSVRINKALATFGICSRREADDLVKSGKILLNSKSINQLGIKISTNDVITFNGKEYSLSKSRQKKIWIFYKPSGLITTHKDEKDRETVFDFLRTKIKERVISIGRLDLNSEGLLLITNDTEFSNFAESPKTGWKRKYKVRVFGDFNDQIIAKLSKGISNKWHTIQTYECSDIANVKRKKHLA